MLLDDIKRIIGRPSADPALLQFAATHPFAIDLSHDFPRILIPNRNDEWVTPEQAMSAILMALVHKASHQFGGT